jgi:hypothetical protein
MEVRKEKLKGIIKKYQIYFKGTLKENKSRKIKLKQLKVY